MPEDLLVEGDWNVEAGGAAHTRARETTCVECGTVTDPGWRGWRAYHIADPEAREEPVVWFYCPQCAYREFGAPGRS